MLWKQGLKGPGKAGKPERRGLGRSVMVKSKARGDTDRSQTGRAPYEERLRRGLTGMSRILADSGARRTKVESGPGELRGA